MKNALTYITRRCPMRCDYCAIRDSSNLGPELTPHEWIEAFSILKEIGVNFNLILGNESWILGVDLLRIMIRNEVPFAVYTTCPEPFFSNNRDSFFGSKVIDNLSCGLDYSWEFLKDRKLQNDMEIKSYRAWKGIRWTKENYPNIDCQGNLTISKLNYLQIPDIITELTELGSFSGMNLIHFDKGGFDFFPKKEKLQKFLFAEEDLPKLQNVIDKVLDNPGKMQHPEIFTDIDLKELVSLNWHCKGDPYGGPTIDADGSLRCCGYRKGKYTPKFSIFDLPEKLEQWKDAVQMDASSCPGCAWSYPRMYHYWKDTNQEFGRRVFVNHAGHHIDKKDWSERTIDGDI